MKASNSNSKTAAGLNLFKLVSRRHREVCRRPSILSSAAGVPVPGTQLPPRSNGEDNGDSDADYSRQGQGSVYHPLTTNADIVLEASEFVHDEQFMFFASVCTSWRRAWKERPKTTKAVTVDTSVSQLNCSFECGLGRISEVCHRAAGEGRLDLLKYAREKGCPWDERTCSLAAAGGHQVVLEYARAQGCLWDQNSCTEATRGGHISVLKWLRENNCPWNMEVICPTAALEGHLAVLRWARSQGCPCDAETFAEAAEGGHLEVLRWLRAERCPWDETTCSKAASGGQLDVLKWARKNSCPWDEYTCTSAAMEGHAEILRFAIEDGCPSNGGDMVHFAVQMGHLGILEYLVANGYGYSWDRAEAQRVAEQRGFDDVFNFIAIQPA